MQPASSYDPLAKGPLSATASSAMGLGILAVMLTVAVYMELKERRIPNWLTLTGMALGLLIGYSNGSAAFKMSLEGLGVGFGFLFIFYVFGGLGGGDVKLMGAVGALMRLDLVKAALFYTTFFGAFLAVMILIWRKDFWLRASQFARTIAFWRDRAPEEAIKLPPVTVPYGIAIAVGCLLALLTSRGS
jgi:prepilin peptidase CpaA